MRLVKIHATDETKWLQNSEAFRLINGRKATDLTDTAESVGQPLPAEKPRHSKTKEKAE